MIVPLPAGSMCCKANLVARNVDNKPLSIQDSFWRFNARVGLQSTDGKWDFSVIGRNLDDELYRGGQADKPGAPSVFDLFGGVVRGRQIIV